MWSNLLVVYFQPLKHFFHAVQKNTSCPIFQFTGRAAPSLTIFHDNKSKSSLLTKTMELI